jgi:purine-binding chemotaxis protein CheW
VTVPLPTWFDDDVVEADDLVVDHVVVRLGSGRYGVRALDVAEVVPVPRITRLPGGPTWVSGVANWRGHVLPVIDLRPVLGVEVLAMPSSARLVVLAVDDLEVGVLAEAVSGLIAVPSPCAPALSVSVPPAAAHLLVGLADGGPAGPVAVVSTEAVLGLRSLLARPRR